MSGWTDLQLYLPWHATDPGWSISDIDWGNFWAALGAIATSVAFIVTTWNLILQREQTKKQLELIERQSTLINLQARGLEWDRGDRERSQAQNIQVRTEIIQGDWDSFARRYRKSWRVATVENASGDPVYDVRAFFIPSDMHSTYPQPHADWEAQTCWTSAEDSNRDQTPIEFLASGQKGYLESGILDYEELEGLLTFVRFTDSQSVRWERDHRGALQKSLDEGW